MAYVPAYPNRINWENEPSDATALNDVNLNKMDYAIYQHDQALISFDGRITALEGASYVNSFNGRTGAVTPAQDDYTIDQIKATGTAGQYVTLDSNGKLNLSTLPAYPTAGHVVVNQSGSTMTQRSKIKFMGSVSVTDDSANDQTVVNITGGGGGGSGHTILDPTGSSMNQRTNLQFTGSGVTVSDNSTDDKTVVNISSSGHTIKDGSGTAMTAQPNLQFVDAKVTNDAQGQATKVQNFVDIDWDDWQEVDDNDDTYYRVLGAPLADGTVEVDLMKTLWENESPTSAFTAQNITLSSSDYDFLLWVFYDDVSHSNKMEDSTIVKKGNHVELVSRQTMYRIATRNSDTSYSVEKGYLGNTENNYCSVPIAIYGIKQKVTISIDAIASSVSTLASKCMLDENTSVADKFDDIGGGVELITDRQSTGTVTVSNLSQFKQISFILAWKFTGGAKNCCAISTLPLNLFKQNYNLQCDIYDGTTRRFASVQYVSDTQVNIDTVTQISGNWNLYLIGIK